MNSKSGFRKDLTGKRFGRLVVLEFVEIRKHNTFWKCQCDCGNITVKQGTSLSQGFTRSCGCLQRETRSKNGKSNKIHKCSDKKLMGVWRSMMYRCQNKKSNRYHRYGGRGIKVCDEWQDIDTFTDWALANGYQHGLTIDRIDLDGMYCPENCRFVDIMEQANNRSTSAFVEYKGERKTVTQWSRITGLQASTIYYRLKHGWSVEDALEKPLRKW